MVFSKMLAKGMSLIEFENCNFFNFPSSLIEFENCIFFNFSSSEASERKLPPQTLAF